LEGKFIHNIVPCGFYFFLDLAQGRGRAFKFS